MLNVLTVSTPLPMPDESREYTAGIFRRESSNEAQSGMMPACGRVAVVPTVATVGSRKCATIAAGLYFSAWRNWQTLFIVAGEATKRNVLPNGFARHGGLAGSNPAALTLYPLVVAAMLAAAPKLSGASADNTFHALNDGVKPDCGGLHRLLTRVNTTSVRTVREVAGHGDTGLHARAAKGCKQVTAYPCSALSSAQVAEIVAAIYRIEGGDKTKYPYGIRSIDTHGDKALAKRICENTVRNNYKRWIKAGSNGDYRDYLANVYCPPSADKQGNINWKRNIHKLVKWTL